MRILWFANTPCGATEKLTGQSVTGGGWLYALSEKLKARDNIDLHIAFYYDCNLESFEYNGIIYHPIFRLTYKNKWQMIKGQFKFRFVNKIYNKEIASCLEVVRQIHPDIIHVHGSEESFGLIANKMDNSKIVLSIQGLLSPYLCKLFSGIPELQMIKYESYISSLLNIGTSATKKQFILNSSREKAIFKNINYIIGRTKWDYDCSLALNPHRKYYVVNEIMRPAFFETEWRPTSHSNTFTIVTTASKGLYKGVESIYQTANILKEAGFRFDWKVIGINENNSIARIVESAYCLRSKELNIMLLGRMDSSQIIDTLKQADLFVQVSHIENSPNSLCEAMILGMPIVATFAGGTSSIIQDGVEGVLVQDGDPYSMAGAIINAKNNYNTYINMGTKARERAIIRHNPDNVVNELLNVYKAIQSA